MYVRMYVCMYVRMQGVGQDSPAPFTATYKIYCDFINPYENKLIIIDII